MPLRATFVLFALIACFPLVLTSHNDTDPTCVTRSSQLNYLEWLDDLREANMPYLAAPAALHGGIFALAKLPNCTLTQAASEFNATKHIFVLVDSWVDFYHLLQFLNQNHTAGNDTTGNHTAGNGTATSPFMKANDMMLELLTMLHDGKNVNDFLCRSYILKRFPLIAAMEEMGLNYLQLKYPHSTFYEGGLCQMALTLLGADPKKAEAHQRENEDIFKAHRNGEVPTYIGAGSRISRMFGNVRRRKRRRDMYRVNRTKQGTHSIRSLGADKVIGTPIRFVRALWVRHFGGHNDVVMGVHRMKGEKSRREAAEKRRRAIEAGEVPEDRPSESGPPTHPVESVPGFFPFVFGGAWKAATEAWHENVEAYSRWLPHTHTFAKKSYSFASRYYNGEYPNTTTSGGTGPYSPPTQPDARQPIDPSVWQRWDPDKWEHDMAKHQVPLYRLHSETMVNSSGQVFERLGEFMDPFFLFDVRNWLPWNSNWTGYHLQTDKHGWRWFAPADWIYKFLFYRPRSLLMMDIFKGTIIYLEPDPDRGLLPWPYVGDEVTFHDNQTLGTRVKAPLLEDIPADACNKYTNDIKFWYSAAPVILEGKILLSSIVFPSICQTYAPGIDWLFQLFFFFDPDDPCGHGEEIGISSELKQCLVGVSVLLKLFLISAFGLLFLFWARAIFVILLGPRFSPGASMDAARTLPEEPTAQAAVGEAFVATEETSALVTTKTIEAAQTISPYSSDSWLRLKLLGWI